MEVSQEKKGGPYTKDEQRTRLRNQLDKVESFQEKIIVEKLILDIDMKIANFQIRLVETKSSIAKQIAIRINEYYEKEKGKKRVIPPDVFLETSPKATEKIYKIYTEDMKF